MPLLLAINSYCRRLYRWLRWFDLCWNRACLLCLLHPAFLLNRRLLQSIVFAFDTGVFGFLILGASQCKKRWPEKYSSHNADGLVIRGSFIQASTKLTHAVDESCILSFDLLAVVGLILDR